MKRILAVLVLLLLCATLVGCTAQGEISYKNGDELTYCTDGNATKAFAEKMGQSKEKLSELMKNSGIIFYGIAEDKGFTVTVLKQKTEFSERITDLSYLSDSALDSVTSEISPDNTGFLESNDTLYIMQDTLNFETEQYPALQYITVKKGNFYIVTFSFSKEYSGSSYEIAENVMSDIYIAQEKDNFALYSVLIALAIIVIIAFITVTVISIIKDIKRKK